MALFQSDNLLSELDEKTTECIEDLKKAITELLKYAFQIKSQSASFFKFHH